MAKSKVVSKDSLLVEDEATWSVMRSGGCKGSETAEQRKARQQERILESTRRQTEAMAAMKMKKGGRSSFGMKIGKGKKGELDEANIVSPAFLLLLLTSSLTDYFLSLHSLSDRPQTRAPSLPCLLPYS